MIIFLAVFIILWVVGVFLFHEGYFTDCYPNYPAGIAYTAGVAGIAGIVAVGWLYFT